MKKSSRIVRFMKLPKLHFLPITINTNRRKCNFSLFTFFSNEIFDNLMRSLSVRYSYRVLRDYVDLKNIYFSLNNSHKENLSLNLILSDIE